MREKWRPARHGWTADFANMVQRLRRAIARLGYDVGDGPGTLAAIGHPRPVFWVDFFKLRPVVNRAPPPRVRRASDDGETQDDIAMMDGSRPQPSDCTECRAPQ